MQVPDTVVVPFAEKIPDRRLRRHHVGLIPAMGNHVMRAMLRAQMLAAKIPADVHQLHRVESASPHPRRPRGMRALAVEAVLRGNQTRAAGTIRSTEIVANVRAQ